MLLNSGNQKSFRVASKAVGKLPLFATQARQDPGANECEPVTTQL